MVDIYNVNVDGLILTKCNGKNRHKFDTDVINDFSKYNEMVKRAYLTHFEYNNMKYCVAFEIKTSKQNMLNILSKLQEDQRIESILPFMIPALSREEFVLYAKNVR